MIKKCKCNAFFRIYRVKNLFFGCLLALKNKNIITGRDKDTSNNLVIARLIL